MASRTQERLRRPMRLPCSCRCEFPEPRRFLCTAAVQAGRSRALPTKFAISNRSTRAAMHLMFCDDCQKYTMKVCAFYSSVFSPFLCCSARSLTRFRFRARQQQKACECTGQLRPTRSAHPARFSPDDKFSRQRIVRSILIVYLPGRSDISHSSDSPPHVSLPCVPPPSFCADVQEAIQHFADAVARCSILRFIKNAKYNK